MAAWAAEFRRHRIVLAAIFGRVRLGSRAGDSGLMSLICQPDDLRTWGCRRKRAFFSEMTFPCRKACVHRENDSRGRLDEPRERAVMSRAWPEAQTISGLKLSQDALRRIAELHLDWRRQRREGRRCMLQRCDLSGLDLGLLNLEDAILVECDLSHASLRGTNLKGADLRGSRFDESNLASAQLVRADLRGARFESADLSRVTAEGADLSGTYVTLSPDAAPGAFRGAWIKDADFSEARMPGVDFSGAQISNAAFRQADMRNTRFDCADIANATFVGARLAGASFVGSSMDAASLKAIDPLTVEIAPAKPIDRGELRLRMKAHADWVDSLGKQGKRLDLSHRDLRASDFIGANLSAAIFRGALLANVNCRDARLIYTDLSGANLSGATLTRADLRGANFTGAFQRDMVLDSTKIGPMPYVDGVVTRGLRGNS